MIGNLPDITDGIAIANPWVSFSSTIQYGQQKRILTDYYGEITGEWEK